jgi:ubiquinone/menaquinone biosynthesis C-methylase UbiE
MKPSARPAKQGLVLDNVVLLGRTLDEYRRYFALDLESLRGKAILDVASGVGSFCAEAQRLGLEVTAFDAIYEMSADEIQQRCEPDLDHVIDAVRNLKTYRWGFYKSPDNLRKFREQAYRAFLDHYRKEKEKRYVPGRLPKLPFQDNQFDLTLVSYFLLVYEDQFDYEFHKQSLAEIMRVTRGEARLYPIVTFEATRCSYLDRFKRDPALRHLSFEEVETDFEFLVNSNYYLRVLHR